MFQNSSSDYFHTRDGIKIFFSTNFPVGSFDNSSPLMIFNYGLACNNSHWQLQLPYFDQLGYQIIIHDYRSHFKSSIDNKFSDCSFENMTLDLFQLVKHFNAKKVIMLGHSMGVNISLQFAKTYPDILIGMVLISGSVLPPQEIMFGTNIVSTILPHVEKIHTAFPAIFNKLWSTSYMNPVVRKTVLHGGFNANQVKEEFVTNYLKKVGEVPPGIFFQLLREMRDHDIINHLETIKVPTLIMAGDQDNVIPYKLQNLLHKYLKNSEFYLIKDGSHVPQVDFPETVNDRINIFCEKIIRG